MADSGQCGTEGPTEACAGDAGDELVVASDAGVSEQIKALYAKYNPDKLASLPAILEKYAGKEDTLLAAIQAKYTNAVKVIDSKNFASFVAGDDARLRHHALCAFAALPLGGPTKCVAVKIDATHGIHLANSTLVETAPCFLEAAPGTRLPCPPPLVPQPCRR